MGTIEAVVKGIERFIERVCRMTAWLTIPLIIIIACDVISRFLFGTPTVWAFDISFMIGTCFFLIALGYTHLHRGHVSVDVISIRFSPKLKAALALVTRLLFFFPIAVMLFQVSLARAIRSVNINERYLYGDWHPSLVPLRIAVFLAFSLLILIGLSQLVSEIKAVAGGERQ